MRVGEIEGLEHLGEVVADHRQVDAAIGEISSSAVLVCADRGGLIPEVGDRRIQWREIQLPGGRENGVAKGFWIEASAVGPPEQAIVRIMLVGGIVVRAAHGEGATQRDFPNDRFDGPAGIDQP